MARHVQITQNNKFAISLQYVKREESDIADILQADKHESLLEKMILRFFDGDGQAFPKFLI